jgi:hypothetical protein
MADEAAKDELPSFDAGGLSDHEIKFARQIQAVRGGGFTGVRDRSAPGIDGYLDGVPVSLKETDGKLSAVLRHASRAERKAANAGYSGVDLFIKAPNVNSVDLADFAKKAA